MGNVDHDLRMALRFFDGKLVLRRKEGVVYARPTDGVAGMEVQLTPAEEREAREAIVRVLKRDPPPRQLLDRIAGAFAPDGPETGARRADLKFRKHSRPSDLVRKAHIIVLVAEARKRMTHEEAIAHAVTVTGETETAIKSVWERERNSDIGRAILAPVSPQK